MLSQFEEAFWPDDVDGLSTFRLDLANGRNG